MLSRVINLSSGYRPGVYRRLVGYDYIAPLSALDYLLLRSAVVDRVCAEFVEKIPAEITGVRCVSVKNYYLHPAFPFRVLWR